MRVALALVLVMGVAAMAWVTFSGSGSPESDSGSPDSVPPEEEGVDPGERESDSTDPVFPPAVETEVPEEIPAYPWAEPAWKTAMAAAISRERVTIQVKEQSLEEVIATLGGQLGYRIDVSGIPTELHPANLSMDLPGVDPMKLLQMVARRMKSEVHLRPGGIQLLPEGVDPRWESDEVYRAGLARARRILDAGGPKAVPVAKLLPVDYEGTTLQEILTKIGHRLKTKVTLDPRISHEQRVTRVTLKSERLTAALVLDDVTAAARLAWAADETGIVVTLDDRAREIREERDLAKANAMKEVELAVKDRPLHVVATDLGKQIGVPVVIDQALWEPDHPRITLRAGPEPLRKILPKLAKAIPARFLLRGEAVYLVPPAGR